MLACLMALAAAQEVDQPVADTSADLSVAEHHQGQYRGGNHGGYSGGSYGGGGHGGYSGRHHGKRSVDEIQAISERRRIRRWPSRRRRSSRQTLY
jgi:hypothetical protein